MSKQGAGLGIIALLCLVGALWVPNVRAQSLDHLEIIVPPQPVPAGQPVPVTFRARNAAGLPLPEWQGSVRVRAFQTVVAPPVLSEIQWNSGAIEITNPNEQEFDLGGWEIQVVPNPIDPSSSPHAVSLRFPTATLLTPHGTMVWQSVPGGPGVVTNGAAIPLQAGALIRLLDPDAVMQDQVWMVIPVPPIPDLDTRGASIGFSSASQSQTRVGGANRFSKGDWAPRPPSFGLLNAALEFPWGNAIRWTQPEPSIIAVTGGGWSGGISLPGISTGAVVLEIDAGGGILTRSSSITIRRLPSLGLSVPTAVAQASESKPGPLGEARVTLTSPLDTDLVVSLSLSTSNEFIVPATLTIPAGSTSAAFPVSNLDDQVADGTARVQLTASATGFESATASLSNEDAQSIPLRLLLPPRLDETGGLAVERGRVLLPAPALHDVVVNLSTQDRLQVPAEVVVPAGATSAGFWIRVLDDTLVNAGAPDPFVEAWTGASSRARSTLTIYDDEVFSYHLQLPGTVTEGTTGTATLVIETPMAVDLVVAVTTSSARLTAPASLTLPAGTRRIEFPLTAPDNQLVDGNRAVSVCINGGPFRPPSSCASVAVLDDDTSEVAITNLSQVAFTLAPGCLLSEAPGVFAVQALSEQFQRVLVDAPGVLSVSEPASGISILSPASAQAPLANGLWQGDVTLTGEGLGTALRWSAPGFPSATSRVDVLRGHQIPGPIADIAMQPVSHHLLALRAAGTNSPASLFDIDASTGTISRNLDLPRDVSRLTLSSDGSVAWIASARDTLQRVDLNGWTVTGEFPLDSIQSAARIWDLTAVPGAPERIVAVVAGVDGSAAKVVLLDAGSPLARRASLSGGLIPASFLIPGRTTNEFFCQTQGRLSRFNLAIDGVTSSTSTLDSSALNPAGNLILRGGALYRPDGPVFDATTLATTSASADSGSVSAWIDETRGVWMRLHVPFNSTYSSITPTALDPGTLVPPGHLLPLPVSSTSRLLRWGDRGIAYVADGTRTLALVETPLASVVQPSLSITAATVPEVQTRPSVVPPLWPGVAFELTFAVTNHGPVRADRVLVDISGISSTSLVRLEPREGTIIRATMRIQEPGSYPVTARVTSVSGNSDPSNSAVTLLLRLGSEVPPWISRLVMGASVLTSDPAGKRVYAGLSRNLSELQDGVAVIDPVSALVEQVLPAPAPVSRLRISADGSRLYALTGTNTLLRWNITNGLAQELSIVATNDTVLDYIPLRDNPLAVVVLSGKRAALYQDDLRLATTVTVAPIAPKGGLGYSGNNLWSAVPGALRRLKIGANGLTADTPISFYSENDSYTFVSDGHYFLFGSGRAYDPGTQLFGDPVVDGNSFVQDPGAELLLTAQYATLYSYSMPGFSLVEQQALPLGFLASPARWGSDGVAVISTSREVLLFRSPLIKSGAAVDLQVSVVPPAPPLQGLPLEWSISVTNLSESTASASSLELTLTDYTGGDQLPGGSPFYRSGSQFLIPVGVLPPHGGATFVLRYSTFAQNLQFSARVLGSNPDLDLSNNVAQTNIALRYSVADLAILPIPPSAPVVAGSPAVLTFVLTNRGPGVVFNPGINLPWIFNSAVTVIGSPSCEDCGLSPTAALWTAPLDAGQSRSVTITVLPADPGPYSFAASALGLRTETAPADDSNPLTFYAAPAGSAGETVTFNRSGIASAVWSAARGALVVLPADDLPAVDLLDPSDLHTLNRFLLPDVAECVAPCDDGLFAWVLLRGGTGLRLNLANGSRDQWFMVNPDGATCHSAVSPAGHPESVVVTFDTPASTSTAMGLFGVGGRRDVVELDPSLRDALARLTSPPDGHVWVSAGSVLREFIISGDTLTPARVMDGSGEALGTGFTSTTDTLVWATGRVLHPSTGAVDTSRYFQGAMAADRELDRVYAASLQSGPVNFFTLRMDGLEAQSMAKVIHAEHLIPANTPALLSEVVPMGDHGVLMLGSKGWLIHTPARPPRSDLQVNLVPASDTVEIYPPEFRVSVLVTNRAVWSARDAVISVDLPAGMTFSPKPPAVGGSQHFQVTVPSLNGGTNITLYCRASISGKAVLRTQVTSATPDVSGGPAGAEATVTVLPQPELLITANSVIEGNSSAPGTLWAWLSRPAPTNLVVNYSITRGTALSTDFSALSGSLSFLKGDQRASFRPVIGDLVPELDKTFQITFTSDQVQAGTSPLPLLLIDDDLPTLTMSTNAATTGRTGGFTDATVLLQLSAAAPFPVAVRYEITSNRLTAGVDYRSRAGWVEFAPGQKTLNLTVPVLGSRDYAPDETLLVRVLEVRGAVVLNDAVAIPVFNPIRKDLVLHAFLFSRFDLQIEFDSEVGKGYVLQRSDDPTSGVWRDTGNSVGGNGAVRAFRVSTMSFQPQFYRVVAVP